MQRMHHKISKGEIFVGQIYHKMEGQEQGPVCVAHNNDFAKEGDLILKVMKFSQNV